MQIVTSEVKLAHSIQIEEIQEAPDLLGSPPATISFNHPVKVSVKAEHIYEEILVSAKLSTIMKHSCSRCLEDFERAIEVNFKEAYPTTLDIIDLNAPIREGILLEIPLYAVCKKDCQGICSTCGKNKNLTPCACVKNDKTSAFDVLKSYKFK